MRSFRGKLFEISFDEKKKEFNLEDEIVSGSMFTHNGEIVDERTKNIIEGSI